MPPQLEPTKFRFESTRNNRVFVGNGLSEFQHHIDAYDGFGNNNGKRTYQQHNFRFITRSILVKKGYGYVPLVKEYDYFIQEKEYGYIEPQGDMKYEHKDKRICFNHSNDSGVHFLEPNYQEVPPIIKKELIDNRALQFGNNNTINDKTTIDGKPNYDQNSPATAPYKKSTIDNKLNAKAKIDLLSRPRETSQQHLSTQDCIPLTLTQKSSKKTFCNFSKDPLTGKKPVFEELGSELEEDWSKVRGVVFENGVAAWLKDDDEEGEEEVEMVQC